MQDYIIVIATTAVLVLGVYISTIDVCYEQDQTDPPEQDANLSCDVCPNSSNLYNIYVGNDHKLLMFVDVPSKCDSDCCYVGADHSCVSYLTDVRGKRYVATYVHCYKWKHQLLYMHAPCRHIAIANLCMYTYTR